VRDLILRWTHVALAQIGQTAVCNRVHEADLRLAHWLLLIHEAATVGHYEAAFGFTPRAKERATPID
jgi:hypothetical protein